MSTSAVTMSRRMVRAVISLVLAVAVVSERGRGQGPPPDVSWRTLRTDHFHVHFTPELEDQARRAAVNAERAYALLAAELRSPRQPIDLVITDNVDFTNGYATPFPTNRIVIYAHPPVASSSLRFYDEWNALVITHELTHIFQFDRARGWWRVAQAIFGRNPAVMPTLYTPAWLTEGLAVYYESRLTGSGRLIGTEHSMIARATVTDRFGPRLDELSLTTSEYPGGQSAYAFGSLLIDHLARTRGPERVPRLVDRLSGVVLPFFLDRAARGSFGVSFTEAWREFRDSVSREASIMGAPMPGWRELTPEGRDALFPRWRGDSTIIYAASTGRDVSGAYAVDLLGERRRIGRRNSLEPNVPLPDGSLLFAQLEFVDPYRVRSDLYVARGGDERRLTRNARLSHPDARRGDGSIIAVQAVPSTTRLVRVSADGRTITPITGAAADTQWSEPRWSPEGGRIAAVRHRSDGQSEIVVIDTTGRTLHVVSRSRSVEGSPSWSPDGNSIFFSSDRTGTAQLYAALAAPRDGEAVPPARISDAATGIFQPEVAARSSGLAAVLFLADGYHIGAARLEGGVVTADHEAMTRDGAPTPRPEQMPLPPQARDTSAARRYSPWRTLVPRYWLPTFDTEDDGSDAFGGVTSGEDVIGRHSYSAGLSVSTASGDLSGAIGYGYAGLGNPLLGISIAQFSDYDALFFNSPDRPFAGWLRERTQSVALSATLRRQRVRTGSSLTVAADLERETFSTRPDSLLGRLDADLSARDYLGAQLFGGWSNTRRPGLAISLEDGISLSGGARTRWRRGGGTPTRLATGTLRIYKALDLPGFAHHVLAARVSGGWANEASTSDFEVGGTSGSAIEIFPGFSVGDSPRTFAVRGFSGGFQTGLRAAAGSVEYRAPLAMPTRGLGLLPFYFDRLSLTLFGDAGAAWCGEGTTNLICGGRPTEPEWLTSAGAEVNLDAALPYDIPYRFRFGAAAPIQGRDLPGVDQVSFYVSLGFPF